MQIHNLIQGSDEWHEFRLEHFGASEAAAMLGLSSRVTRNELLHMKFTGTPKEYSDWVQANILDYGHEVEALARPIAEEIIGEPLYPVTCEDDATLMSASCDGLTLGEDTAFEHKQWNAALADAVANNELPEEYQPQAQQIMAVTGAQRVLFVVSDGTRENMVHMWVYRDPAWEERIRAGWAQFQKDLLQYEPQQYAPKPAAEPIKALPALTVQLRGEVVATNLPMFKAKADAFIAAIKTDLVTDDDFANAEATIKFCEEAEGNLEQAKRAAIAQTASIDELMRTVDHISAQLREKRLLLTRTVKDKKDLIKAGMLAQAKQAFAEHVAALEAEIAPLRLVFQARDFAGAMRNKRTLATLQNALDTELANGKITVDAIAADIRRRLAWYRATVGEYEALFADLQAVIQKPDEDFQLLVNTRISEHRAKELARVERLRAEAEAKAAAAAVVEQVRAAPAPAAAWPFPEPRAQAAEPVGAPTLRLGQIADRLGFTLTADFLRALGFEPAGRDKAAVLYHEGAFPQICQALVHHILQAQDRAAAVAA